MECFLNSLNLSPVQSQGKALANGRQLLGDDWASILPITFRQISQIFVTANFAKNYSSMLLLVQKSTQGRPSKNMSTKKSLLSCFQLKLKAVPIAAPILNSCDSKHLIVVFSLSFWYLSIHNHTEVTESTDD